MNNLQFEKEGQLLELSISDVAGHISVSFYINEELIFAISSTYPASKAPEGLEGKDYFSREEVFDVLRDYDLIEYYDEIISDMERADAMEAFLEEENAYRVDHGMSHPLDY